MPQRLSLYSDLTVAENVRYFARIVGAGRERVIEVLDTVGLAAFAARTVTTLSGGQQARVSLAVALLGEPELLLLDEPTVGLDPVLRLELWETFHELARGGATLLVTSHVMDEADRCDRLLLMRDGAILAEGTAPGSAVPAGHPQVRIRAITRSVRLDCTAARRAVPVHHDVHRHLDHDASLPELIVAGRSPAVCGDDCPRRPRRRAGISAAGRASGGTALALRSRSCARDLGHPGSRHLRAQGNGGPGPRSRTRRWQRAECVMLNKGPYAAEAVSLLDDLLGRMEGHQFKKADGRAARTLPHTTRERSCPLCYHATSTRH